jgi:hypothetical protein
MSEGENEIPESLVMGKEATVKEAESIVDGVLENINDSDVSDTLTTHMIINARNIFALVHMAFEKILEFRLEEPVDKKDVH